MCLECRSVQQLAQPGQAHYDKLRSLDLEHHTLQSSIDMSLGSTSTVIGPAYKSAVAIQSDSRIRASPLNQ